MDTTLLPLPAGCGALRVSGPGMESCKHVQDRMPKPKPVQSPLDDRIAAVMGTATMNITEVLLALEEAGMPAMVGVPCFAPESRALV